MNIIYRAASKADIPALATLATETLVEKFGHLYSQENLNSHLQKTCSEDYFTAALKQDSIHLALDGDKCIGYAKWGEMTLPVEKPIPPSGEIHRLYVDSDYQGQKIGHRFMEIMLDDMADKAALYLSVFSKNEDAQRFYQRYGFQKHSEYNYMVGTHADHEFIYWRKN